MQSSRSGRLLSGGTNVELVLFESSCDNALDDGVSTALISHLISQCLPSHTSLITSSDAISDYVETRDNFHKILLSAVEDSISLWEQLRAGKPKEGVHLIVIDDLHSFVSLLSLGGLVRLLHAARDATVSSTFRLVFATVMHCSDFSAAQVNSIKSLGTSVVQVVQEPSKNRNINTSGAEFEVWNQIRLRIGRRKRSGRVNVDVVIGYFDAEKFVLTDVAVQSVEGKTRDLDGEHVFEKKLNLPFKVSLSESERASRSSVTLPYVHRNEAVADSALELHPKLLQVVNECETRDSYTDLSSSSDEEPLFDEDGEELFSEDV